MTLQPQLKLALLATALLLLPVVAKAQSIQDVSVGEQHACTLDDAGNVDCFTTIAPDHIVDTTSLPAFTDIAAGQQHTCGITLDGGAQCWGNSNFNALAVPLLDAPLVSLASGANHTCAIDTNADVVCWGLNTNLQLEPPVTNIGFSKVEAANNFTCGILTDGDLTCWSNDDRYNTDSRIAGPFTDLDVSSSHICALDTSGNIICNQLSFLNTAQAPANGPYIDVVTTPGGVVCGLTAEGLLDCEFRDNHAQEILDEYAAITDEVRFSAIESATGYGFFNQPVAGMCGVRADDGSLLCFGSSPLRSINNMDNSAASVNLSLSAIAHDLNFVELFWNRQETRVPPVFIEIYRDGELLTTTDAQFSYIDDENVAANDGNTEATSTYSIRAINENGSTGAFSNEVTVFRNLPGIVDSSTDDGLINPRLDNNLRINNLSLLAIGQFSRQSGTLIATWDALDESNVLLAGYEVQLNNETVAFTRSTIFLEGGFGSDLCGAINILAIDDDGQIIATASAPVIIEQFRRTC